MKLILASAVFAGLARPSSGVHVWYNAKGQFDGLYSCSDTWTDGGFDGPKIAPTSKILRKDCESLAESLSNASGFWNLDHWSSDDSQCWLPLKVIPNSPPQPGQTTKDCRQLRFIRAMELATLR